MLQKVFESVGFLLKSIIIGALLVAGAAAAIVLAFSAVMAAFRIIGLLWREVFSFSWPLSFGSIANV